MLLVYIIVITHASLLVILALCMQNKEAEDAKVGEECCQWAGGCQEREEGDGGNGRGVQQTKAEKSHDT